MKHFNYNQALSAIHQKHGAFFALSSEQFKEQKKEGVQYASMGCGLICPKENCDTLYKEMEALFSQKIQWELEHNTKKEIIWYELGNHECQISGGIESIVGLMESYGITRDEILAEWPGYFQHCVENDYF